MYRKQSKLTQSDISFIMDLSDVANISRWELGLRSPNVDMLIIYHLLFNIPVETLFARQKQELTEFTRKRIGQLLEALKLIPGDSKVASRVAFLDSVLTRLSA
jgi:transcriptional regulator with XRE-family HTH domain